MGGEDCPHPGVKSGPNCVVAMKQVNEVTAAALKTCLEVPSMTNVFQLALKNDTALPYIPHDCFGFVLRGVIIDHLNLHLFRAKILCEHTH
jgi:hypothetical protein